MTAALVIVSILAAGAMVLAGWWYASLRAARREIDTLRADRDHLAQLNEQYQQTLEQRANEIAEVKEKLGRSEERLTAAREEAKKAQDAAAERFKALAGDALSKSMDEFRKQAESVFKAEHEKAGKQLEANKEAIANLVKPVKESLEGYQKKLSEAEQARVQAYGSLKQQAEQLAAAHQRLESQTGNLVRALRRPEVRGRWGEMQLKRVAELAGMIEYVDFVEQDSIEGQSGRLRPDMVIKLPSERQIVVDAKTPLDAYLAALESADDTERETQLDRHAKQIETQVGNLAGKQYTEQFANTPDFVVLFIPGESFLQAALARKPGLMEAAFEKNVVIATPSTLISLLRAVAMGWREQALAENAKHIADLGRDLHDRLAVVIEHITKLGSRLESTVKQYNQMVGSVDSRLMPAARRFEELKADSAKTIESVDPLETGVRDSSGLLPADADADSPERTSEGEP